MEKLVLVIFLLDALVCLATGQHHLRARVGPWRHRIQWENNGQLYSLLSTGTQYRSPAHIRRRTQLLLTTKNNFNRLHPPVELRRSTRTRSGDLEDAAGGRSQQNGVSQTDASVLGADAGQYLLASGRPGRPSQFPPRLATSGEAVAVGYRSQQAQFNGSSAAFTTIQEFSGSGVPRGGRSTPGDDAGAEQATAPLVRSQDFTHSRGGRIISISENSESTVRSPATTEWVAMAEDSGNVRRIPQQTSPGDARIAQGAHSQTRITPESNVSPTALSSNAVEMYFPRPRPDTIRTTDTSDPRDPHSFHHRNSVFYNLYPPDHRNRITVRPPPGPGHGTRFFHNGEANRRNHLKSSRPDTCSLNITQRIFLNYKHPEIKV